MKLLGITPFHRTDPACWHGKLWSLDPSVSLKDFTESDLDRVVLNYCIDEGWDGTCAAVLKLKDGRYATYESSWGPTGHGFYEDAYGGHTDIYISDNLLEAVRVGLTPDSRERCWQRIITENLPRETEVEEALVLCKLEGD